MQDLSIDDYSRGWGFYLLLPRLHSLQLGGYSSRCLLPPMPPQPIPISASPASGMPAAALAALRQHGSAGSSGGTGPGSQAAGGRQGEEGCRGLTTPGAGAAGAAAATEDSTENEAADYGESDGDRQLVLPCGVVSQLSSLERLRLRVERYAYLGTLVLPSALRQTMREVSLTAQLPASMLAPVAGSLTGSSGSSGGSSGSSGSSGNGSGSGSGPGRSDSGASCVLDLRQAPWCDVRRLLVTVSTCRPATMEAGVVLPQRVHATCSITLVLNHL